MKNILVIAEIADSRIRPLTYELVAAARRISDLAERPQGEKAGSSRTLRIVVVHEHPDFLAQSAATETGMPVIGLKVKGRGTYTSETCIAALAWLARQLNPSHILAAHSAQGRGIAPGLAVRIKAAALAGVQSIRRDAQGFVYLRPVCNNTRLMVLAPTPGLPVVATLLPGCFEWKTPPGKKPGSVEILGLPQDLISPPRMEHLAFFSKHSSNQLLKEARVVVSAGRGIGEKENLDAVFRLAQCFPAAAVGASRPLVDMGWLGYPHQVGITGATVSPELYIACGISGSSQHLAGMKTAGTVVSINKNPQAPMCRHADVCVNADVMEFIALLMKRL